MRNGERRAAVVLLAAVALVGGALGQSPPEIKIQTERVAGDVYVLSGGGGNVAVLVGEDGLLLVDCAAKPAVEPLLAAVKALDGRPVRLLVNTHWHFDHVDGNQALRSAGAVIVAHEAVRQRMSTEQKLRGFERAVPPSPAEALPMVTYADGLTLHLDGEEVQLMHVEPAHTDGDSFVQFKKANVLHVGDTFFNGMYPYIDIAAGGSIDGMIKAVDRALELADEKTKIIPGHGPLAGEAELLKYRGMLVQVRDRVRALIAEGKTLDEVIAARVTQDLDEEWNGGVMPPDKWIGLVYEGMKKD